MSRSWLWFGLYSAFFFCKKYKLCCEMQKSLGWERDGEFWQALSSPSRKQSRQDPGAAGFVLFCLCLSFTLTWMNCPSPTVSPLWNQSDINQPLQSAFWRRIWNIGSLKIECLLHARGCPWYHHSHQQTLASDNLAD